METLTLSEAAEFLKVHPQTLRQRAKSGEIPGAKVGRSWVFLEEDLVRVIRARYSGTGRASVNTGDFPCSTDAQIAKNTGAVSPAQTERRYEDLLALPSEKTRRSSKTN